MIPQALSVQQELSFDIFVELECLSQFLLILQSGFSVGKRVFAFLLVPAGDEVVVVHQIRQTLEGVTNSHTEFLPV